MAPLPVPNDDSQCVGAVVINAGKEALTEPTPIRGRR
jgi:hypothetical protein